MGITVNVTGETSVSVTVDGSTGASVIASGGIGPAGFVTAAGTATLAFGVMQLAAGNGITISTASGQFLIASYNTAQVAQLCPVTSVAGKTGDVVVVASDITAGTFSSDRLPSHTHAAGDIVSGVLQIARIPAISYTSLANVPVSFSPSAHTHNASDIATGTLSLARLPAIPYTTLSGVPTSFAPSAHTHSTTDVVAFTAAASAAAPVQSVQGRTGAVSIARADLTAAAFVHTHSAADITNLTNVANVVSVYGVTGAVEIVGSGIVSVSKSGNTISINAAASTATAAVVAAIWPAIVLGG